MPPRGPLGVAVSPPIGRAGRGGGGGSVAKVTKAVAGRGRATVAGRGRAQHGRQRSHGAGGGSGGAPAAAGGRSADPRARPGRQRRRPRWGFQVTGPRGRARSDRGPSAPPTPVPAPTRGAAALRGFPAARVAPRCLGLPPYPAVRGSRCPGPPTPVAGGRRCPPGVPVTAVTGGSSCPPTSLVAPGVPAVPGARPAPGRPARALFLVPRSWCPPPRPPPRYLRVPMSVPRLVPVCPAPPPWAPVIPGTFVRVSSRRASPSLPVPLPTPRGLSGPAGVAGSPCPGTATAARGAAGPPSVTVTPLPLYSYLGGLWTVPVPRPARALPLPHSAHPSNVAGGGGVVSHVLPPPTLSLQPGPPPQHCPCIPHPPISPP